MRVTPTSEFGRMPEMGRLRFGVRAGKAMKAITTWRFTSYDDVALAVLAQEYGGRVTPWSPWPDRKSVGPPQFEVISESAEIAVFLPDHALSVAYELWTAGGLQRRCDGVTAEVNGQATPCICHARQRLECKPHTRLRVILPGVRFAGVWRMETKGWNATHHLSDMERTLIALQEHTGVPLRASLQLVAKERMKGGHKQQWIEPHLRLEASPEQLMAGQTALARPTLGDRARAALGRGDGEVIEAEIVEEDSDVNAEEWAAKINREHPADVVDDHLMLAAKEIVRRHPWLRNDDNALNTFAELIDPGIIAWMDLPDVDKRRVFKGMTDVLDGKVRLDQNDAGGIKLVRVRS